jgi:energy-coupling factor transport system permease protein
MSVKPILVPLVANSLGRTQVLGLTMDMRGYRSRQSVEKNKLSWNKADVAAVGGVVVMGLGVVLGGLM